MGSTWFRKSSPTSSCKRLGQGRGKGTHSVKSTENVVGDHGVSSIKPVDKAVSFLVGETAPMLRGMGIHEVQSDAPCGASTLKPRYHSCAVMYRRVSWQMLTSLA